MRYEHLYLHVPFCARRCSYCDFSIAVRSVVPVGDFVAAVEREWDTRHAASVFALRTVYFGGGTPSKLGADGVARLLGAVNRRASLARDAEITLEANPEDITADAVRAWRAAGVNRLSIGVQSFDDRVLKWMHRTHDADHARRVVDVARGAGIENVSIDLIFAVPDSLERNWRRDLDAALALDVPHLSVYGLTVEAKTPLGRWVARREATEAPEERFESEFFEAHRQITAAGFEHYEVSNYGRPGKHSAHNWAYWQRAPYAGLGPSAHEFDGRTRRWNAEAFADWEAKALRGAVTEDGSEDLSPASQLAEETYLGLRTMNGMQLEPEVGTQLRPWIEAGWATMSGENLRLTATGWLRLDSLAADLTARRSRY